MSVSFYAATITKQEDGNVSVTPALADVFDHEFTHVYRESENGELGIVPNEKYNPGAVMTVANSNAKYIVDSIMMAADDVSEWDFQSVYDVTYGRLNAAQVISGARRVLVNGCGDLYLTDACVQLIAIAKLAQSRDGIVVYC